MPRRRIESTFLVEHYRAGLETKQLERWVARIRDQLLELERQGSPARFLCSVIVPADEAFLVLVQAESEQLVREAYLRAEASFDRISVAIAELIPVRGNHRGPEDTEFGVPDWARTAKPKPTTMAPSEPERNKQMRITKRTLIVAASLLMAIGTAMTTAALAGTAASPVGRKSAPLGQQLNGTWTTTVQLSDAPPGAPSAFTALDTFLPGGGLLVSSSAANPALRGLAHGAWVRTGNRQFASTFVWFRFDPTGQYIGTQRVRRTIQLAKSLKSFQSTDVIEVISPTGAVVATIHGTEAGTLLTAN